MNAINFLLTGMASVLFVLATIYSLECMVAVIRGAAAKIPQSKDRPVVALVVPAHDEAGFIGDTVRHLQEQLIDGDRLLVVADNCSDDTAAEARAADAEVLVRTDPSRRGKGYAISYALDTLAESPPGVVVFVDADCRLSDGLVDTVSRTALATERPVQSCYIFSVPAGGGSVGRVSAFAVLVRNLVRPVGLLHLGFPCHLTGSGMAFLWSQIRNAPPQEGSLVEDLSLGLDLAIDGHEPILHPGVLVTSDLPQAKSAAQGQRRRWEHGQISTFISKAPRLIASGISQRRLSLVVLALDLAVPPLALLVLLIGGVGIVSGLAAAVSLGSLAFRVSALALTLIGISTILAWLRYGRDLVPIRTLLAVPFYVLWKIPVYLSLIFRGSQKDWVRTDRDTADTSSEAKADEATKSSTEAD
jgi:cellulose synthase/poly-beta-1,6-N-acetylglucosamine synthase-like glycosyltransferase